MAKSAKLAALEHPDRPRCQSLAEKYADGQHALLVIPFLVVLDLLLDLLFGQPFHPQIVGRIHHFFGDARREFLGFRQELRVIVFGHFIEAMPLCTPTISISSPTFTVQMRLRTPRTA